MDWEPEFSVGIDAFDAEHMKLFDLVNEFKQAHADGKGAAKLEILFASLEKYVVKHFAEEEAAMKAANYPGFDDHCSKHEALQKQISSLWERYDKDDAQGMSELIATLDNWLKAHILEVDMGYKDYL